MTNIEYIGTELELFSNAVNWKRYWADRLRPLIRGDVVEVGAGIGANTRLLETDQRRVWVCLEPDARLISRIACNVDPSDGYEIVQGTLEDLEPGRFFDTAIYIDVLEHIEDDRGELRRAASRIRPAGCVVVLSPAHQQLYTPFDAAIGHHRRYSRRSLRDIGPPDMSLERLEYLDSIGLAASLANRLILKQAMPTTRQIRTWDSVMIPMSRVVDPCLMHRAGKSIVAVWRKGGSL
jgi:SAM-dependent methyltransferase